MMPEKFPYNNEKVMKKIGANDQWYHIIQLYYHFNRLKNIYRKGWLDHGIPPHLCESVADHTGGTAFLVMIITNQFDLGLNTEKLLKMALIHDLAESKLGDITPREKERYQAKAEQEIQVITDWFSGIPGGKHFIALFKDFEHQESKEARFLKKIDKIEMMLQAIVYENLDLSVNLETFYDFSLIWKDGEFMEVMHDIKEIISQMRKSP